MLSLQRKSYYFKIKYLLPMLGVGIGAARIPIIDILGVGAATNFAFVDGDFNQATGLQGNGTTKYFDSLIKPSQIGSSSNGGLGWWENNISFGGNVEPMGTYSNDFANRFVLDFRSNVENFRWGNAGNGAGTANTAINAHYYGQRSSVTNRELFRNGVSLGTNSTSDSATGASNHNMYIMGVYDGSNTPWPGRCALVYYTDGTLSQTEITDFNITLIKYLMIPTGKPQS